MALIFAAGPAWAQSAYNRTAGQSAPKVQQEVVEFDEKSGERVPRVVEREPHEDIWGDNTPFHADANVLASALFDSSMKGDYIGSTVVKMKVNDDAKSGLLPNHLLTTGLEHVFEGITIAAITLAGGLNPLIWSSDGNVVTAFYDHGGKRAILDGGFTRLYNSWDTAGTGRYVKNAAAWLVNVERFGDDVVAAKTDTTKDQQ